MCGHAYVCVCVYCVSSEANYEETLAIPYSRKIWRVLNLANWLPGDIGEFFIRRSEFLAP